MSNEGSDPPPPGDRDAPGPIQRLIADPHHGPLPAILIIMTMATGAVDAVSILSLGRVFVANMTGNVVFVGFALVGAKGFSLAASLFALGGFLFGALGAGRVISRLHWGRALLLRDALAMECALVGLAILVIATTTTPIGAAERDAVSALLAFGLGLQNSVVRSLSVPDLTTTVLTMTLTAIAADHTLRDRSAVFRRVLAVVSMLGGAICGALLVLREDPASALGLVLFLLVLALGWIFLSMRSAAEWQMSSSSRESPNK